jgi:uncharacterized membrane protein
LADSDYLAREIASLRLALGEIATRDYIRGELRDMVADLREQIEALKVESEPDERDHTNER